MFYIHIIAFIIIIIIIYGDITNVQEELFWKVRRFPFSPSSFFLPRYSYQTYALKASLSFA